MVFSEKLALYSKIKRKYASNNYFLYITRFALTILDTESDPEKIMKAVEQFEFSINDSLPNVIEDSGEEEPIENEGEAFEW